MKTDPPKRSQVTMPLSLWAAVARYQKQQRIGSLAEALRQVLLAGLRSLGVRV